jgi:ribosomal protein S12 methylthiotransferase accessory factor
VETYHWNSSERLREALASTDGFTGTKRADSLARLESAVSCYTGIVHRCYEVHTRPNSGQFALVNTSLANADVILGDPEATGAVLGSGANSEDAFVAAVGEAIERYALSYKPRDQLVVGRARDMNGLAVEPSRLALHHQTQYEEDDFPFAPFTVDTEIAWVPALNLTRMTPALVPAHRCWFVFSHDEPLPGSRICITSTNGMACGPTMIESVLAGLMEVLERDAFMLTWYHRLSLPLLEWNLPGTVGQPNPESLIPIGTRLSVIDLSGFHGVPSAFAMLRGTPPDPVVVNLGGGKGWNMATAYMKAVAEACSGRLWLSTREPTVGDDDSSIVDMHHHLEYYADGRLNGQLAFLDGGAECRPVSECPALRFADLGCALAALVGRLSKLGVDCYAVDMTPPDVRELGLYVVKVICPELRDIDSVHRWRFLGGDRLLNGPCQHGLGPLKTQLSELNHDPHPFP